MSNVRFYRLGVLPSFEVDKHKGIFVHVTGTMNKTVGKGLWMEPIKVGDVGRIDLEQWLTKRRIDSIASGLWFGGENGWELLSNETNSGAINDAIEAKIATLHVNGYAQATISGSTLTISGIREDNGIIAKDDSKKLEVAIDGVYNETSNKIATQSTVTTAINGLNTTETIQAVTKTTSGNITTLTFNGVKETNGVIAQGTGTDTFTVGNANLKIQIGSAEATNVFSANATEDSTIKLDGYVFKKNGDVISVITPTAVSESNKLVTQQDIANLSGAMHYKGPLTGAQSGAGSWPQTVAAGDVYIVTTGFTHSDESNPFEVGDMIVFNSTSASDYKVVQSNLTLGTGDGQIAKNVGALANGNLVVATQNGIKTIGISETQLTGDNNNKRELSYRNGTPDTDTTNNITLYHDVTIKDALHVIGKDFTKSINISSTNRSIEIAANASENATGVMVDLVWNTTIE